MKRNYVRLLLLCLGSMILLSCATGKEYRNMVACEQTPGTNESLYLRSIQLEPLHTLRDLERILPGVVRSILAKYGIPAADREEEADLVLDMYLQRKDYQKDYEAYASIILSLTVSREDKPVLFLLHTEDTPASPDSFPFLFSLLDENISRLSGALFRDRKKEPGE